MSRKADFWKRHITKDEREHFKVTNDPFYLKTFNSKEDLTILNMFVSSLHIPSCMKQYEKLDKICKTVVFEEFDSRQQRTVVPLETGSKEPSNCLIYRHWCRTGEHKWILVACWMEDTELMIEGNEAARDYKTECQRRESCMKRELQGSQGYTYVKTLKTVHLNMHNCCMLTTAQ